MVLAGAGLLWMGWSGFNGGGPFVASTIASLAVLNTHVCTAASIIVWITLDTFYFGKPTVFGAVQGMITGLVCITPAAGTNHTHNLGFELGAVEHTHLNYSIKIERFRF
jgi:Amt family ammonium transporter